MPTDRSSKRSRANLRIRGRVQGVYYRGSMVEQARRLGLNGWVMNRADGSVESVVEGATSAVEALIAWCHQGPRGARVDSVEVRREAPGHDFSGFVVRR